ncbi:hypothetical protein PISL3812_09471 [Talaromyces islandicus]|uniref:PEBP-like protein n=1 Tax=Talaromyces islandicus TaxID=28573 RepID=A0A0U1MAU6_TALIS|nr:hypothetical protein PISL3812_09471 [Talaromyces islandicus]
MSVARPDVSKLEDALRALEDGTYRTLGVSVGSKKIAKPGLKIVKKHMQLIPTLFAPPTLPHYGTYTMICLDLDAPFISWNPLGPVAHWIHTNFKISQQHQRELQAAEPPIARLVAAGPPPLAAPHRYVVLLYKQNPDLPIPSNLKAKGSTVTQRT